MWKRKSQHARNRSVDIVFERILLSKLFNRASVLRFFGFENGLSDGLDPPALFSSPRNYLTYNFVFHFLQYFLKYYPLR